MKGQPLACNKDNQEDKEPLFDTVDTGDRHAAHLRWKWRRHHREARGDARGGAEGSIAATDLAQLSGRARPAVSRRARSGRARGADLRGPRARSGRDRLASTQKRLRTCRKRRASARGATCSARPDARRVGGEPRSPRGLTAPDQVRAAAKAARRGLDKSAISDEGDERIAR